MSRSALTSNAFALLACSTLLFASMGCNPGGLTTPETTSQVVTNPNFIRILSTSKGVQDLQGAPGAPGASKMISAEDGGTFTHGRVTLEFPPNALDTDTEISIRALDDETLSVELGPHGIRFNRSVTMKMDLEGTNAEGEALSARTLWYNESEDRWEEVRPAAGSAGSSLSAELDHFSKYNGDISG